MIAAFSRLIGPVLGLALLAALALAGYQAHRANRAEASLAGLKTEFADYRRGATELALRNAGEHALETARRLKVQSEVIHAQVEKTRTAEAAAGRAAAADRGLRGELARLAARGRAAAGDPAAVAEREAAAAASAVLAELLGQCSERRTELARYADTARIAGEACERSYDALTPTAPTE